MSLEPEITIVTLFAGRFVPFEGYFDQLEALDYPKGKLHFLGICNATSGTFRYLLNKKVKDLTFKSSRVIFVDEVDTWASTFHENRNQRDTLGVSETVAYLYNEVFKQVETEMFLFIEDDIYVGENALRRLLPIYERQDRVGYAGAVVMSRWDIRMMVGEYKVTPVFGAGDACTETQVVIVPPDKMRKLWGVVRVGSSSFCVALLKKSVVNSLSKPPFKPHFEPRWRSMPSGDEITGVDITFCQELTLKGYNIWVDFNVRGLHVLSNGAVR